MKLLIISDLHFDEKNDWTFINNITQSMVSKVKRKIIDNEELIVIVLGDIVNCGGRGNIQNKFAQADMFIEILKNEYNNIKFLFIPGNHEIVANNDELTSFNEFCKRHSYKNEVQFTTKQSVYACEEAGINIILADTTLNRQHDAAGNIDTQAIATNLDIKKKNLIFMHHPPCDVQGVDRSVVNSKELIATRSNFIFYGHQHGGAVITDFLKGDTDIHSVGTLLRQEIGAIHEFLLLDIADGRINFAYRYTFNGNSFIPNILFPSKDELKSHNLYLSSPNIVKSKVARKLKRNSSENDNPKNENSIWSQLIGVDIDSVLAKHNKILIVGDAGIGKSYELASIYERFKEDEDHFPLWIDIRNSNYESIRQNIEYAKHNTIDRKLPCLIIDGLDEIESINVSKFIKDVGAASYGNPEVKIIISVRTNFKISIDGFIEYKILPLDTSQIKDVAIEYGVTDVVAFNNCLDLSGCSSLAQIPFYLFDIIQLYLEKGTLPNRDELFNRIITYRFKKGDDKFPVEPMKRLMSNEFELREWLKELSFFMQSQHLHLIDNVSYTQYFTPYKRGFFDRTGLISCKESEHNVNWEFNHNIFREYFVATYIYKLPFNELLELITFDDLCKKLRPSWVNTVSFVFSLRKEEDLKNWLIENAKEVLIQFESDRLGEEERDRVFISIMEDSFIKEVPVYAYFDEVKLSRYFQSEKTIDYIIEILRKPSSERAVLSCLRILSQCTSFFEKEMELRNVILGYVNCETPEYVVSRAVSALTSIFYNESQYLLEDIFSRIKNDNRPDVIEAISKLIVEANDADNYIDYILDKLNQTGVYKEKIYVNRRIEEAASTFSKAETIIKSLNCLAAIPNTSYHYNDSELFGRLIFNALQLEKNKELVEDFVNIFIKVSDEYDRRKIEYIKKFFVGTETLTQAFKLLLTLSISQKSKMFAIEAIMDESLTEILIESYVQNELDSKVYKWYVTRLPEDSKIFKHLNEAVKEKEGSGIQREEKIDWEKIRRQSRQIYFDSLFDKKSFSILIQKLMSIIDVNIKCNELLDNAFDKIPSNRQELQSVLSALYHWGGNSPVANFIDFIEWGTFSISQICDVLKNKEMVTISTEQEKLIRAYYDTQLEVINFEILDESNSNHDILFSHTEKVIYLMKKFAFPCSDHKLLEMLMLPWQVFSSSTVSSQSEALKFILERVSNPHKVQEKILSNLETKVLSPPAAHTHIIYCLDHNFSHATKIAEEIFKSTEDNSKWFRNTAIDYLIAIKGERYVDDLIGKNNMPDADLLNYLEFRMKINNECLISKLIEGNENSKDYKLYLGNLIRLNTQYGIKKYIELVKRENTLPDISDDKHVICSITDAIREISQIELLDCISELLVISHSEDFVDSGYFGLKSSLGNAISRLIQVDALKVKNTLLDLINQYPENKDLISKLHWYLKDAEVILTTSSDLPLQIEDTLKFIKQHKSIQGL